MLDEVRREVCAMLTAEEEGHACLLRALESIRQGEFMEAKSLLQRAYFRGCALVHVGEGARVAVELASEGTSVSTSSIQSSILP